MVTGLVLVGVNCRCPDASNPPVISVKVLSAVVSCALVEIWPVPVPNVSVSAASVPTWTVSVLPVASAANVAL